MKRILQSLGRLCAVLLALSAQAQSPMGTDLRSWATADITSLMSFAGTWESIDGNPPNAALIGPFYNVIKLGTQQREGVALGGWVFNGMFGGTQPDTTPSRAALFAQQDDGTLRDVTATLLGNNLTDGVGAVLVADFNGDGMDDLVLPAHNESPFIWRASTAWMSGPGGTLTKIRLPDAVMDHDAKVVTLDGKKKILARSFGGSGNGGQGAGFNPMYSWNGSNFTVDLGLGDMGGMSVLAGPFTGNADNWLIIGGSTGGGRSGVPPAPTNPMLNFAYKFNGGVVSQPPIPLPKPYFNDKPQYATLQSLWDPYSKSHTARLWTTDLNQDGLPDILAGQEIFGATGLQKYVYQLLVNRGNMAFVDQTDALAPEFSQDSQGDYSARFLDVDGSGIDTVLLSSGQAFYSDTDAERQGQYILVNDGTGRLYAAMHAEFRGMGPQVANFLRANLPAGTTVPPNFTPKFVAYRTSSGALNFLAIFRLYNPAKQGVYGMVNVPLQVNVTTDFRRDLTVSARNGSRRIRTFAGNDTIHRALSDPDCSIDGGLGENTVVYPGPRRNWIVNRIGDSVTVRPAAGPGGTDSLKRIQRASFDDMVLRLESDQLDPVNFTSLWWNPAESGWGLNVNHQGDILFATLFTYDATGAPLWLVMSGGALQAGGATYAGDLYRTTGPAFNSQPFTPITAANISTVGTMSLTFPDADHATLRYSMGGAAVTKLVQRQVFGSRAANCAPVSGSRAPLTNYQDLWWKADEPGWGLNITHQDSTVFATLFTYDASGKGLWLVMSAGVKQPDGSFLGDLYRTSGPAFNAQPFTPITAANITRVGSMQLRFTDGSAGVLAYTVNGIAVNKPISRQVFAGPVPACSN